MTRKGASGVSPSRRSALQRSAIGSRRQRTTSIAVASLASTTRAVVLLLANKSVPFHSARRTWSDASAITARPRTPASRMTTSIHRQLHQIYLIDVSW